MAKEQTEPHKKGKGPPKGHPRWGGRKIGTRNKAIVERERQIRAGIAKQMQIDAEAKLAAAGGLEKAAAAAEADVATVAATQEKSLLEMGLEFTKLFGALAVRHQPWPDSMGRENPRYDQVMFEKYATLAMQGIRDLVGYQSPKLSAAVIGAVVTNKLEIIGGIPDEIDGSFKEIDGVAQLSGPATVPNAADRPADVPPEPSGGPSNAGPVQGNPLRKAVG